MRKVTTWGVLALLLLLALLPGVAGAQGGVSVTCDDGASFDNGVQVIVVQMRSGFTYTATAVGIDGFDPVLAVLDETGEGLCSDDSENARVYAANLPSSGAVSASNRSAQVRFSQNSREAFADVSLVVGGYGNTTGEFLLILEGMAATAGDGAGDPFSVRVTPNMLASGVPLSVYMLTRGNENVDPLIYLSEPDSLQPFVDDNGDLVACDDAGNANLCWGDSVRLDNYSVTIATGRLPGWQYDAMLALDLGGFEIYEDMQDFYLTFVGTRASQREGQYLLVFHIGTAEVEGFDDTITPNV